MNLADMQRDFYAWLTDGALTVEPQVPEPARRGGHPGRVPFARGRSMKFAA